MVPARIQLREDLVQAAFRRFDVDQNGVLTHEDMKAVFGDTWEGAGAMSLMQEVHPEKGEEAGITPEEMLEFLKRPEESVAAAVTPTEAPVGTPTATPTAAPTATEESQEPQSEEAKARAQAAGASPGPGVAAGYAGSDDATQATPSSGAAGILPPTALAALRRVEPAGGQTACCKGWGFNCG